MRDEREGGKETRARGEGLRGRMRGGVIGADNRRGWREGSRQI